MSIKKYLFIQTYLECKNIEESGITMDEVYSIKCTMPSCPGIVQRRSSFRGFWIYKEVGYLS